MSFSNDVCHKAISIEYLPFVENAFFWLVIFTFECFKYLVEFEVCFQLFYFYFIQSLKKSSVRDKLSILAPESFRQDMIAVAKAILMGYETGENHFIDE